MFVLREVTPCPVVVQTPRIQTHKTEIMATLYKMNVTIEKEKRTEVHPTWVLCTRTKHFYIQYSETFVWWSPLGFSELAAIQRWPDYTVYFQQGSPHWDIIRWLF